MRTTTESGANRTGIGMSPMDSRSMIESAEQAAPSTPGDEHALDVVRGLYEQDASPLGTVPPPTSLKGAAKTAAQALKGRKASVFLDKLGERLAFERTGIRLYELLISRFQHANGGGTPGPSLSDLEHHLEEELSHFILVREAIEQLGGDPTAETPCADASGVASSGVVKVLQDPRTTLNQCLEALLIAELTDNDAWQLLTQLAQALGQHELAQRFTVALQQEHEHLLAVRRWLQVRVLTESLPARA